MAAIETMKIAHYFTEVFGYTIFLVEIFGVQKASLSRVNSLSSADVTKYLGTKLFLGHVTDRTDISMHARAIIYNNIVTLDEDTTKKCCHSNK